mgnify:FL=1
MNQHEKTPLIKALDSFISKDRTIMHMPGHKQGKGFDDYFNNNAVKFDLTELPGLDNFHKPEGAILESLESLKKAFGSLKSFFLVNGSTSGIHAGMLSCFKRGDKVLVNRNCHISVIHALILFGIEPVFVMPDYMDDYNLALPPGLKSWERVLDENPDAKGAFVTTPDYYGICQPLSELSALLHQNGKILLVDEAHGAHFAFSARLPETALEQGADICIQSFHKTLPALTQAAVLHIGGNLIDPEKVGRAISMITTTSPSYIVMASIDYARDYAERNGEKVYGNLIDLLENMKTKLSEMKNLRVVPDKINNLKRDPTRIVIDTTLSDMTGYDLYNILFTEYRIAAEMCDTYHVVFIAAMADTAEDMNKITRALTEIDRRTKRSTGTSLKLPFAAGKCSIPDLYDYLASSEEVPLTNAAGRTCAEVVTPYPPGIPVLCPGEVITKEHVHYLNNLINSGQSIHGLSTGENGTKTVRVIEGL